MEENNFLEIQLIPSYGSTSDAHDYDSDNEDADGDAILVQQGLDINCIQIEKGEKFKISSQYSHGIVDNIDNNYKFIKKNYDNKKVVVESDIELILEPGQYRFHNDGITIEQL